MAKIFLLDTSQLRHIDLIMEARYYSIEVPSRFVGWCVDVMSLNEKARSGNVSYHKYG